MEFVNPTITVSNTSKGLWLVKTVHEFGAEQYLDFAVLVEKSELSLVQVQHQALEQLHSSIGKMLDAARSG